jgi:membrane protein required for colicin V production
MRKLSKAVAISGSDRLLGMVFGLVRGFALVTLVVLLLGFTAFRRDPWWNQSRLLPNFEASAHWLGDRLPAEVARYLEPIESMTKSQASPPSKPAPSSKPSST